jgi:hypothetical protein
MPCAQADPLHFTHTVALQNNGNTRVDLFSNPGVTLTGHQVGFLVDITGTIAVGETHSLLITYTELGSPTGQPDVPDTCFWEHSAAVYSTIYIRFDQCEFFWNYGNADHRHIGSRSRL